jgi:hypothetical protein
MNEEPGEADGDEHGEEDKEEHEAPRGAIVRRPRGCPGWGIFLGIGHFLVYGEWLPQRDG